MSNWWIGRGGSSSHDHAVEWGQPIGKQVRALCGETVSVVMGDFRPNDRECRECSDLVRSR